MRRALTWLIEGIPLNVRSRRAVDETLADWAHEEQEVSTQSGRLLVALRGALSLLRVASLSVTRETFDFSWCRGLGRRCLWVLVIAGCVTHLLNLLVLADVGWWAPVLATLLIPILIAGFLPPIVFLVFGWRPVGRTFPATGAALCVAGATFMFMSWGLPALSESFARIAVDGVIQSVAADSGVSPAPPAPVEGRTPRPQRRATPVVGFACLVGATLILASVIARRSPVTSRWWLVGAPIGYIVLMTLLKMSIGLPLLLIFHIGDRSGGDVLTDYIGTWLAVALVLGVALARAPRSAVLIPNGPAT